MALMYSYLNISISKNIVPDGIKGREIHHSFPMTLFQVQKSASLLCNILNFILLWELYLQIVYASIMNGILAHMGTWKVNNYVFKIVS